MVEEGGSKHERRRILRLSMEELMHIGAFVTHYVVASKCNKDLVEDNISGLWRREMDRNGDFYRE